MQSFLFFSMSSCLRIFYVRGQDHESPTCFSSSSEGLDAQSNVPASLEGKEQPRGLDALSVVPASLEGKEQPRGLQPIQPFRLPPPTHPPACLSAGGLTRGSGQVHKVVMESGASLHVQHHFDKSTRHPTKYRRRQQILLKQLVYSADAVSVAVQSSSSHKDNVRSTAAEVGVLSHLSLLAVRVCVCGHLGPFHRATVERAVSLDVM